MDRTSENSAKNQVGFFEFIVLPPLEESIDRQLTSIIAIKNEIFLNDKVRYPCLSTTPSGLACRGLSTARAPVISANARLTASRVGRPSPLRDDRDRRSRAPRSDPSLPLRRRRSTAMLFHLHTLYHVLAVRVFRRELACQAHRQTFLEFFEKHATLPHTLYPSCPVIPLDDPTLLFINAGMNQFKPIFSDRSTRRTPMAKLNRAANSQKCIRAGGKHNDLDDVGKDVYQHTFFEMLGNWKLWQLLQEGGRSTWTPADEETRQLWLKYLPAERVLPFGCKEQLLGKWATSVRAARARRSTTTASATRRLKLVNADLPDVIEIWNNVFIQFNREVDGKLGRCPNKHVDTGMGFERLASILQGKTSNYDTDVFTAASSPPPAPHQGRAVHGQAWRRGPALKDMAYGVVADHIRTLTFAHTDGAMPSNDGRGYVLAQFLNAPSGFLSELVPVVVGYALGGFPELAAKEATVKEVILDEEQSFGRTLNKGIERFKKIAQAIKDNKGELVIMAEEEGNDGRREGLRGADASPERALQDGPQEGATRACARWCSRLRRRARSPTTQIPTTDDLPKYEWRTTRDAKVLAIFTTTETTSAFVDAVQGRAQSGGQIYDTGALRLKSSGAVALDVDSVESYAVLRDAMDRAEHTMTHVLNFALRKVLRHDRRPARFARRRGASALRLYDNKGAQAEQLLEVETICNELSSRSSMCHAGHGRRRNAKRIQGPARGLWRDRNPDVRLERVLVEFCGGTHLRHTREAKKFGALRGRRDRQGHPPCLGAVGKLDGSAFIEAVSAFKPVLDAALISLPTKDQLRKQLDGLVDRVKKIKKELAARARPTATKAQEAGQEIVVIQLDVGTDAKLGRDMLEPCASFMIVSTDADANKTAAFTQVSQQHMDARGLDARTWVNHAMAVMNGKGGGKDPSNATGQAKTTEKVAEAVALAKALCKRSLGLRNDFQEALFMAEARDMQARDAQLHLRRRDARLEYGARPRGRARSRRSRCYDLKALDDKDDAAELLASKPSAATAIAHYDTSNRLPACSLINTHLVRRQDNASRKQEQQQHSSDAAARISCVDWYRVDGGLVVTSGVDGVVKVWDADVFCVETEFSFPDTKVFGAKFSRVATTHSLIAAPRVYWGTRRGWALAWSLANEFQLATGSRNGEIRFWDIRRSGATACLLALNQDGAADVPGRSRQQQLDQQFTDQRQATDASHDAAGGRDGIVVLSFADESAASRATATERTAAAQAPTLEKGRRSLGSASSCVCCLARAHSSAVNALAFTPDGRFLLEQATDDKLRLWHGTTGEHLFANYEGTVSSKVSRRVQLAVVQEGDAANGTLVFTRTAPTASSRGIRGAWRRWQSRVTLHGSLPRDQRVLLPQDAARTLHWTMAMKTAASVLETMATMAMAIKTRGVMMMWKMQATAAEPKRLCQQFFAHERVMPLFLY
ncbi:hypothetical protein PINS_up024338 [Pythium insidiosum]|nr:hypothetical protein PINS_up024338 [Pythium insidiosum]